MFFEVLQQGHAHADQDRTAMRDLVQPAKEFLPGGLGLADQLDEVLGLAGLGIPSRDLADRIDVRVEPLGQCQKKSELGFGRQFFVECQPLRGQLLTDGLARLGQQTIAGLEQQLESGLFFLSQPFVFVG